VRAGSRMVCREWPADAGRFTRCYRRRGGICLVSTAGSNPCNHAVEFSDVAVDAHGTPNDARGHVVLIKHSPNTQRRALTLSEYSSKPVFPRVCSRIQRTVIVTDESGFMNLR